MTPTEALAQALREVGITPPPHNINTGMVAAAAIIEALPEGFDIYDENNDHLHSDGLTAQGARQERERLGRKAQTEFSLRSGPHDRQDFVAWLLKEPSDDHPI